MTGSESDEILSDAAELAASRVRFAALLADGAPLSWISVKAIGFVKTPAGRACLRASVPGPSLEGPGTGIPPLFQYTLTDR